MDGQKRIHSALISVFHKDGLEAIVRELDRLGVHLYSTGGTQEFIEGLGVKVTPVEDLTTYPSILGGRVKTLHPKVFGGILGRRDLDSDVAQLEEYQIPTLDLVIVDLYPFEATVAKSGTSTPLGVSEAEIIEKIDIGGISLIRAAAKNHRDVVIIPAQQHYAELLRMLKEQNGSTTLEQRKALAASAFAVSSHYDGAIYNWFTQGTGDPAAAGQVLRLSAGPTTVLRYGENPHQKGAFHGDLAGMFTQLSGKELSYNNLLDLDAAAELIDDLATLPGVPFAILKHNNACGAAVRSTVKLAWDAALQADPVSAFGGVLITTAQIDKATAEAIDTIFFEIIAAPGYDADALDVLKKKKNRMILALTPRPPLPGRGGARKKLRSALNGILTEDADTVLASASTMKVATTKAPTAQELKDLVFAMILVKHTKSNAIVLAKNDQLLASGTGQTSRVDALEQAITKASKFHLDLHSAVMASDAFFPFPDCVEIAGKAGITAIVHPGGSIRDQESIDYCNAHGLAMCITGHRHFKH